jgi:hypothetical protein
MTPHASGAMLDVALSDLKEQAEGWRLRAVSVDDSADTSEFVLGDRTKRIGDAAYEIDDLLCEDHWMAVEEQLGLVEGALRDTDGELVTLSVLRALQTITAEGSVLAGFAGDVANACDATSDPWEFVRVADRSDADVENLDEEEYLDWLGRRRDEAAGGVRDESAAVAVRLRDATEAAGDGDTLGALRQSTAARRALSRARQAYDEWFAALGAISNVAPDRLRPAASGGLL